MLKTVSIVLMVAMGLVACDGAEQKQSNEQKVNVSETASQTEQPKPIGTSKTLCDTVNVEQWSGFDEAEEEPKCQVIQAYQLSSYHCDISKKAFGFEQDAAFIESGEHRIFAYSNDEICRKALDVHNSNAP